MTEETTMEAPPKRRGRPPKAQHTLVEALQDNPKFEVSEAPKQDRGYDEITYIPGDSDPTNTTVDFDHVPTRIWHPDFTPIFRSRSNERVPPTAHRS